VGIKSPKCSLDVARDALWVGNKATFMIWDVKRAIVDDESTLCFKKWRVEFCTITLSTVNRFWTFLHCWKQQ